MLTRCKIVLPNIIAASHQLLDRYIIDDVPGADCERDDESIVSMNTHSGTNPFEPVKLCMIVLSLIDQVPIPDVWTYGQDFVDLQSRLATIIRNDLIADKPMPWARRTPTWSMNILRYLQHHVSEFVDEELIEALDTAVEKQDGMRQRLLQTSMV